MGVKGGEGGGPNYRARAREKLVTLVLMKGEMALKKRNQRKKCRKKKKKKIGKQQEKEKLTRSGG